MLQKPLVVSLGDPSGIGPDIIISAWQKMANGENLPGFFVTGNRAILEDRAKQLGIDVKFGTFEGAASVGNGFIAVLETGSPAQGTAGVPDVSDANTTIRAIDLAVQQVFGGEACGIVTCPINKDVLYKAGFKQPGHTEYLGLLAQQNTNQAAFPVMMLAGPDLRTIPVTIHVALAKVQEILSHDLIVETAVIASQDLKDRFGVEQPRIAVAGLNPHAGENGSMGREEIETIIPAVRTLQEKGVNAVGPLPADTMFHKSAREKYDVALCMYHDQALIPAKMLGFDDAVNVTLGLPFIRTSPDHGTAYDIAGTGRANPSSFIAALHMAAEMAERS